MVQVKDCKMVGLWGDLKEIWMEFYKVVAWVDLLEKKSAYGLVVWWAESWGTKKDIMRGSMMD
jgi:hypothetical protein